MSEIQHDIKWFLKDPTRLLKMKPFTRGGSLNGHGFEGSALTNNTYIDTGFADLTLKPISQDTYITEYRPDLHHIILNKSIPHIKVVIDGEVLPSNIMEVTQTAAFQKLIHSAHVRNLTANPLEFTLFNKAPNDDERRVFDEVKQEWGWRGREWNKYQSINVCKQLGNCGTLFFYDKQLGRYDVANYSYEDGYQIIPNYNEYGDEIARSLAYQVDGKIIIDTYDAHYHYRSRQTDTGWDIRQSVHGFSRCPLLHKRGKVAWEYAESSIEMYELMVNINAITLKRFGTFGLAFWGELDAEKGLQRDSSTLVVNLSADTTNGRQDVRVLEYPEPKTMGEYIKFLEEQISLLSSTSFITPKDITSTGSGGNGIALAMSNDYAVAMQGSLDWRNFVNDMVFLHQEGLDLELNNGKPYYSKLRIGARIIPWSLETNNTKITNLAMEAPYLSRRTIIEKCPDAAPDEIERVLEERGSLNEDSVTKMESEAEIKNSERAFNLAVNKSNEIVDNN